MNQAERRRKKLLEHTKTLYSDNRAVPAIHPRYKAMYQQLYGNEIRNGSLGARIIISIIVLGLYIAMDYNGVEIKGVDKMQVVNKIMQNHPPLLY